MDWVPWTEAFAKAAVETGGRAKAELGAKKLELRLTGRISALANKEVGVIGWRVVGAAP